MCMLQLCIVAYTHVCTVCVQPIGTSVGLHRDVCVQGQLESAPC